jgi:hypothetical protein
MRLTDIDVTLHHETEAAVLVSATGDSDDAVWLPKSIVEENSRMGTFLNITLPEKMAVDKGLV